MHFPFFKLYLFFFTNCRYSQNIEDLEYGMKATLIIEKTERKDSSLFMCTAINDFGEDTMNIQITVKGKLNTFRNILKEEMN